MAKINNERTGIYTLPYYVNVIQNNTKKGGQLDSGSAVR